uniref:Predicted protein n=1 Tax=Hordeum vulgare subsp. vulgare TaxID=112509 RepID=F2D9X1_HORVV|nr:predicted protein [Hordeum vulgare subsp. vulgare]
MSYHSTPSPSPPRSASWVGHEGALPVASSSDLEQSNKTKLIRGRIRKTKRTTRLRSRVVKQIPLSRT